MISVVFAAGPIVSLALIALSGAMGAPGGTSSRTAAAVFLVGVALYLAWVALLMTV